MTKHAALAAALLLSLALGGRAAAAPLPDGQRWSEYRSAHFTIFSCAPEERTRAVVVGLETLREVLRKMSADQMLVNAPIPTYVYVFPDEKSFAPYRGGRNIAGFFQRRLDGNYVAVQVDDASSLGIVYHEYLHYFVERNIPALPLWLDEGLAEFYRTMERTKNGVDLGGPPPEHLELLRSRIFPLDDLAKVDQSSPDYNEQGRQGLFYATSWAVADYMLTGGGPKRRAQFTGYMQSLAAGTPPARAFSAAFGGPPGRLEEELRAHLRRVIGAGVYHYWRVRFDELKVDEKATSRPLARDEALARTGLLLADPTEPGARQEVEERYRAALAINPRCAAALFGEGLLRAVPAPTEEAREFFRRAVEADPDLPMAHYLYAVALGSGRMIDEPLAREIRAQLESDLALSPGHAEARRLLDGLLPEAERAKRRRADLEEAFGRAPSPLTAQPLVNDCFDARDFGAARAALEQLLAKTKDPVAVAWARQNVAVARFNEGALLVAQKKTDEGRTLLRRAVNEAPTPELREALRARMEQAMTPPHDYRADFQRAVEASAAGRTDEAKKLLERIVQEADDSELIVEATGALTVFGATGIGGNSAIHLVRAPDGATVGADPQGRADLEASFRRGQDGDMEGELAILDRLAVGSTDPALQILAANRAASIRSPGTEDRAVRLYNAAVEKKNHGDVKGAIPLMEEVAKTAPREALRQKAIAALARWRKQ